MVEFLLVFGLGGEFSEGGHSLVDIAIHHGPLDAEVFGDELWGLVPELYPLEDFELAERDAVAEILDEGGDEGVAEGVFFPLGLVGGSASGAEESGRWKNRTGGGGKNYAIT